MWFDAFGRQSVGQIRSASSLVALTATIGAQSKVRPNAAFLFAATARIKGHSAATVTPGFALKTIINGQAKARATPGIIITARLTQRAYASADIHVQGTLSTTRKALLLDGSAPITASYWKGNA